jgi:polyferredoxin
LSPSPGKRRLRVIRRIVQVGFLALFLYLIVRTAEPLDVPVPANSFLRMSPFLAVTATLSARTVVVLFIPALVVIVVTIVLGRVFCGWVCPLGTTLDISDRFLHRWRRTQRNEREGQPPYHTVKYAVLVAVTVAAAFGVQVAGWFDPICIATRTYGITLYPYANFVGEKTLHAAVRADVLPGFVSWVQQVAYQYFLAFKQPVYRGHILFLLIFFGIALLGLIERRFWCRHLCPLGGMLDLVARVSPFRRYVRDGCTNCLRCQRECKMGAITGSGEETRRGECIECFACDAVCPEAVSTFSFRRDNAQGARSVGLTRRGFVGALVGGVAAAPILRTNFAQADGVLRFVRPPGADDESELLAKCVRCGECIKVCITGGLQPVLLEAGVEALWTPKLVPRVGYCEYKCTLCGRVCPTGALPSLSLEEKQETVLGTAFFDRNRCIPWAENRNCAVCEECCPTPTKSIVLRDTGLKDEVTGEPLRRPYVRPEVCIGCGLCEFKCPLPGRAAVMVGPVRSPELRRRRRVRGGDEPGAGQRRRRGRAGGAL